MVFEMVTLGEHTFNQGADPVVKIGFRNVATDTWVTVDNDTVTLQVLYYTHYHTTNYTSWSFSLGHFQMRGVKGSSDQSHLIFEIVVCRKESDPTYNDPFRH